MVARIPPNMDVFDRSADLLAKPVFHVIRHPITGQIVEPNRAHGGVPVAAGFSDDSSRDAFGRWRVSAPYQLYGNISQYNERQWRNRTTLGATITREGTTPVFTMRTTGTVTSRAVSQSRVYLSYIPDKSQLISMSGVLGGPQMGVAKRIGYFDDDNGLFFQMLSTGPSVVVRSNTSGAPLEDTVVQSNWNIDRLDGTGVSGLRIDFTKAHIFEIDFQWLGAGRVRFGVNINGIRVPVHEFLHANYSATVYMSTPHLPVRYEVLTISAGGTGGQMSRICASAASEGGDFPNAVVNYASLGTALNTVTTREAILAIRPKRQIGAALLFNNRKVYLTSIEVYSEGQTIFWELEHVEDPATITGTWVTVSADSSEDYSLDPGYTGGTVYPLFSGYVLSSSVGSNSTPGRAQSNISFSSMVGNSLVRNPYVNYRNLYILFATSINGTATKVGATLNWESYD